MEMTREQITSAMLENLKPWPQTGAVSRPTAVVQTSGVDPAKGHTMSTVISEFESQVAAAMTSLGLTRQKAIVRVAKQHPELHSEYVKQTDGEYKARQRRR